MKSNLVLAGLLFIASSVFSQTPVYTEKEKTEFYNGTYNGCMDKQAEGALNKTVKPKFIQDVCVCFGNTLTNEIFSNMDFQLAMGRKDNAGVKAAISRIATKESAANTFHSCLGKTEKQYGGIENIYLKNPDKSPSNKVGLVGDSRDSFVEGGIRNCLDAAQSRTDKTKAYCACAINTMADNVSPKDLYNVGMKNVEGNNKMRDMTVLGQKRCTHLLN